MKALIGRKYMKCSWGHELLVRKIPININIGKNLYGIYWTNKNGGKGAMFPR